MSENKSETGKNFLVQGSILAIAGVITKIIGAVYRIPLVNILGDKGMGYYGVAFQIYAIALITDFLQSAPCSIQACLCKTCQQDNIKMHIASFGVP